MDAKNIRRVLVIGPGTMGSQIAFQCALFDCQVKIYGRDTRSLERGQTRLAKLSSLLVRGRHITKEQAQEALARIQMTSDQLAACEGAQLVSESVPEEIDLKRTIWNQIGKYISNNTILTTNSSSLVPSQLAKYSGYPENFLSWHFHLFCYVKNVVDIMPHSGTNPECVETISAFSKRIKQTPIILQKENQGYVFNAMLFGFLAEAMRLAINNVASIEDIDRSWMKVMNTPQGPFGLMNLIGFNNVYNILEAARKEDPGNASYRLAMDWLKNELNKSSCKNKANRLGNHRNSIFKNHQIREDSLSRADQLAAA
jgi:3-hydroxybutyryl-CoA dehydrogenase